MPSRQINAFLRHPGKSMLFYNRDTEKIELVARPATCGHLEASCRQTLIDLSSP